MAKRTRKLRMEYRRLADITPYARNPRINDDAAVMLAKSIADYEYLVPIIVTSDGTVVAGHTRVKALTILGYEEVEVVVADSLTPQQADEFRLVDNRVAQEAGWDMDLLNELLTELEPCGFDLESFGFAIDDLDMDIPVAGDRRAEADDDAVAEDGEGYGGGYGGCGSDGPKRVRCPHCGEWFLPSEGEWDDA